MADIVHDFFIKAQLQRVFEAVSDPRGLDQWWTKHATGRASVGAEYQLSFGPAYDWRAVVSDCSPPNRFELHLTEADADWRGTRVGFLLSGADHRTDVRFYHRDWPDANEHYRVSCFCWAMYLRLLRRHLENGETVPYEDRLDV